MIIYTVAKNHNELRLRMLHDQNILQEDIWLNKFILEWTKPLSTAIEILRDFIIVICAVVIVFQLEGYQINQLQLNPSAEDMGYGRHPGQTQGDALFHPLECEPTLQIGYLITLH